MMDEFEDCHYFELDQGDFESCPVTTVGPDQISFSCFRCPYNTMDIDATINILVDKTPGFKEFVGNGIDFDITDQPHQMVFDAAFQAWQEATKQRDAQYELMAEHTALSIREDAIIGERKRIMEIIDSESYYAINARVKERIEQDSN